MNIAYLGVVAPYKGLEVLAKAMILVKERLPTAKLFVVGDHCVEEYREFKNRLGKLIRDGNIQEHVVFTGWRYDAIAIYIYISITYIYQKYIDCQYLNIVMKP